MRNLKEGLRWLDQAQADLKTAKDCLKDENYYASAFFSQQAAEKAVKGFLYSKGLRAIITHSVLELVDEATRWEKDIACHREGARELDRHYIGSRYPNFYPEGPAYKYYTLEIANKCLSFAESILNTVTSYLKR